MIKRNHKYFYSSINTFFYSNAAYTIFTLILFNIKYINTDECDF